MTCPVLPTCLFARLHASRIVWPACKPAASDVARVGARACACARAVCSPALGRGPCSFRRRRRRILVGHPACLPRRPGRLQPIPPVFPERGGAFGLPSAGYSTIVFPPVCPSCRRYAPKTRDPARAGATVGRCHPAVRACQVWGLGVQHQRRNLDDCPPFSLEICGSARTPAFFQVPRRPCL
jgi:hypothetical protein